MNIERYAQLLGLGPQQMQEFQGTRIHGSCALSAAVVRVLGACVCVRAHRPVCAGLVCGCAEFRDKYQAVMKTRAAAGTQPATTAASGRGDDEEEEATGPLGLPARYDSRYKVNFILVPPPTDTLSQRQRDELADARAALHMFLDFQQKRSAARLQAARREQETLPIFAYRDAIIGALQHHQVVVVSGATGCGKSTQVPQFLLRAGYQRIVCTQPRRIAAVSLCRRVAHETLNEYGDSVGYQIRFAASRNRATRILFATEGVLVRQMNSDPDLRQYAVIVADEVHERHLSTDLLLTLLRDLVPRRPDLKVGTVHVHRTWMSVRMYVCVSVWLTRATVLDTLS